MGCSRSARRGGGGARPPCSPGLVTRERLKERRPRGPRRPVRRGRMCKGRVPGDAPPLGSKDGDDTLREVVPFYCSQAIAVAPNSRSMSDGRAP